MKIWRTNIIRSRLDYVLSESVVYLSSSSAIFQIFSVVFYLIARSHVQLMIVELQKNMSRQ